MHELSKRRAAPVSLQSAASFVFASSRRFSKSSSNGDFESVSFHMSAADSKDETGGGEAVGGEGTLEDAARREREYLRERLRNEMGREPSEEELSEWLRRHTEGY